MFEKRRPQNWSDSYWNRIKRNIGPIKILEQEKLRSSSITIFGLGGLGGSVAEQLAMSGIEYLTICDNQTFKESNLNRQICTREDIGKYKVDIIEKLLRKKDSDITVYKYYVVSEKNISKLLRNTATSVLTLDDPVASILIARECLKRDIPLLESWGIPYLWAWWFTSKNIDYETCYRFDTNEMTINEIKQSEEILLNMKKRVFNIMQQFPSILETYDREKGTVERLLSGQIPFVSFAPIVRMTVSYLSFEIIFSGILKIKQMILAPNIIGFDYIQMKPINFRVA
ncbi:MAG: ThiF family adenylyltransferase [Candidatus Lokiarchaeota archaeon]|nr:ThiF family adenylyltransferase [Candidatus Lokiarchaeota archaeon]